MTAANDALVLGVEAATPVGGVALADASGRLIAHCWRVRQGPISVSLLADLDALFHDEGLKRENVRAIGVSLGPGAFTGLRVGLATAKTLARGWGAKLYGFSTLELAARRWPIAGDAVAVLLDARRGEMYGGLYRIAPSGRPAALRPDSVESIESLLNAIDAMNEPFVFAGDGAWKNRAAIDKRLGGRAKWAPPHIGSPGADAAAIAAAEALGADIPSLEPLQAAPLYLRPSDAEKRHGVHLNAPWSA
ncbi:tRNA (adenosine(37)-N6)-threonylcarbamoyltransferase complex dimerization subunit type 1 TsaB [bacterium]|nr:tRNA (adenosine(37)-N6)-threonylcarbamoyltransferase complex dimerization subunit type 1 TsaB [bacterium]